jgi:lipopolysaccharide/colanic/teichoic acid biosynthesis glycosyltransferase
MMRSAEPIRRAASRTPSARRRDLEWKRPFDLTFAALGLLAALPLLAALALAVVLESPGPALFGQERVGRQGSRFRMWKLRTMRHGCDDEPHRRAAARWFAGRRAGGRYKSLDDARITRLGRLLRRTNLDELPQLFNVLHGEMSLVGPRPAIPYELEHYRPAYFERLRVPPGMTGLWQVNRRTRLSAAGMMELDLRYAREASPWLDIQILARTPAALLVAALREEA